MNCDPLARWYRWLEYAGFGRALERTRLAFLDTTATATRVLVLGDGDGRFLRAFLKVNPRAEIDCVDSSAKMLALARQRVGAADAARVRFHHADAVHWQPPMVSYDLIVISAGFDAHWRDPLANLMLEAEDFAWATSQVMEIADRTCDGRIVSLLEGGYDLKGLGDSVAAHVSVLMGA